MSRRLPVAAIDAARPQPSRRVVLQGGVSSPLFLMPPASDTAAGAGAVWLARHFEAERLATEWATLEARLVREYGWLKLSRSKRNLFMEQVELDALTDRMDALEEENLAANLPLAALNAVSAAGVERKLEVALACHSADENAEGHRLMESVLRDFRTVFGSAL